MDLRQQWDDLSVDRLLDMFVVSKMTGLEKPVPVEFEEFPLENDQQLGSNASNQLPDYLEEWTAPPTSTTGKVREGKTSPTSHLLGVCLLWFILRVTWTVYIWVFTVGFVPFLESSAGSSRPFNNSLWRPNALDSLIYVCSPACVIILMFLLVLGVWQLGWYFFDGENHKTKDGESRKKAYKKSISTKEEKKEKRGKRDSEDGRVAGKQGSRRATSLLNLFTSSSSSSPNAQGRFLSHSLLFFPQNKKIDWHTVPFLVSSRRANAKAKQKKKTGITSFYFMLGIFFPTSFSTLVEKETVFPLSWFRKRARKQKPSLQLKLGFQKKKIDTFRQVAR